jgi:hypothetical protein
LVNSRRFAFFRIQPPSFGCAAHQARSLVVSTIFGRSRASPDQAAEKQAELASIAEQKRQQEAA